MNDDDAFEAWWAQRPDGMDIVTYDTARAAWVAALEWERAQGDNSDPSREHIDFAYCSHCERDTRHLIHDSGHERDSSGDWTECQECGSRWSGRTNTRTPPRPKEPK